MLKIKNKRKQDLIAFYKGKAPDNKGRFLYDIWHYSDVQLESTHNYIQWLFPLPEKSRYNPDAPLLNKKFIDVASKKGEVHNNLITSFELMLRFYGFVLVDCEAVMITITCV